MFVSIRTLFSNHQRPGHKVTSKLQCEALEKRELLSLFSSGVLVTGTTGTLTFEPSPPQPTAAGLALINSLPDTPVRSAALADYQRDGVITRNGMIDIFFKGTSGYTDLTNAERTSLQTLVTNAPTVAMPEYVQFLATKALARQPIGGASPAQTLKKAVDNFFLGLERPDAGSNGYIQVHKPLWNNYPSPQDVYQTYYSRTNWLLTGLEEVVWRKRADIMSMFIDNGDQTYTVRFYTRQFDGTKFVPVPFYVTVDNFLPNNSDEAFGDTSHSGVLWAALTMKAYCQANAYGGLLPSLDGSWGNSYKAVGLLTPQPMFFDSANPTWVFQAVTGLQAQGTTGGGLNGLNANLIRQKWLEGQYVTLVTRSDADPLFYPVGGTQPRWYALINYAPDASRHDLFTVTEDGKRLIEVGGDILADQFLYWASSSGSPAPVPQGSSAAAALLATAQEITVAGFAPPGAPSAVVVHNQSQPILQQNPAEAIPARSQLQVDKPLRTSLGAAKEPSDTIMKELLGDLAV